MMLVSHAPFTFQFFLMCDIALTKVNWLKESFALLGTLEVTCYNNNYNYIVDSNVNESTVTCQLSNND